MKSLLKFVCMRTLGIAFTVLGAIALALVWMNMGAITRAIMNQGSSAAQTENVAGKDAGNTLSNSVVDVANQVSSMAQESSKSSSQGKKSVDKAANKINSINGKMNQLIEENRNKIFSKWSDSDQSKYQALEEDKKRAIGEYNEAAIEANRNTTTIQSGVMGFIESLIPKTK